MGMMNKNRLNRRDFSLLAMAAMGGIAAGCQPEGGPTKGGATNSPSGEVSQAGVKEAHLCRGLNTCKGLGGGASAGKNSCAGQGDCATVEHHSCGGQNTCKGLGGCGADAGKNDCKGKGGCAVPLMEGAWTQVRASLEEKMKAEKKEIGPAPPKKKKS